MYSITVTFDVIIYTSQFLSFTRYRGYKIVRDTDFLNLRNNFYNLNIRVAKILGLTKR